MLQNDKAALARWKKYKDDIRNSTPVEQLTEAEIQKKKMYLEAHPLEWIKYFFPKYTKYEFAPFQIRAIKRILSHPEWYEVWAWARELAKSTIAMFCVMYLVLTGVKRCVLLISATLDSAIKLLAPYIANFEANGRLKQFYGDLVNPGSWSAEHFVLKNGASFTAIGTGQSPRGLRNEEIRPDLVLTDDFDTDKDCQNPETLNKKWDWWEKAAFASRAISEDTLYLWNGNFIAKDTCVGRAAKMADYCDVVNLTDKDGNSTWPGKNTPERIERIKSKISTKALQGEYYNNPVSEGKAFRNLMYGKVPPLKKFKFIVIYGDPSYSNRKDKKNSFKAVWAVGYYKGSYYLIDGYCARETNDNFIEWYYILLERIGGQTTVYCYVENNTLQDPFFEQVLKPIVQKKNAAKHASLYITGDDRRKPDKATRIEGKLEPLDREGKLIFNEEMEDSPHMKELRDQFQLFELSLPYPADGPDCIESAAYIIDEKMKQCSSVIDTIGIGSFRTSNRL